jgi:hypothetical protein
VLDRILKILERQRIDLQRDEAAIGALVSFAPLGRKWKIFKAIIGAIKRVPEALPSARNCRDGGDGYCRRLAGRS